MCNIAKILPPPSPSPSCAHVNKTRVYSPIFSSRMVESNVVKEGKCEDGGDRSERERGVEGMDPGP